MTRKTSSCEAAAHLELTAGALAGRVGVDAFKNMQLLEGQSSFSTFYCFYSLVSFSERKKLKLMYNYCNNWIISALEKLADVFSTAWLQVDTAHDLFIFFRIWKVADISNTPLSAHIFLCCEETQLWHIFQIILFKCHQPSANLIVSWKSFWQLILALLFGKTLQYMEKNW